MARKNPSWADLLVCGDCRASVPRTGPVQIYCRDCSAARAVLRGVAWKRENPTPYDPVERKARRRIDGAAIAARGARFNAGARTRLIDADMGGVGLVWSVKFSVPYTAASSKNHIFSNTPVGHLDKRAATLAFRDKVAARAAFARKFVVQNKVWISIFVQKPHHRSDAVNVVDYICDGIKVGLGIDDRWFSIGRLDWEISKDNPQIYIGIGQESLVQSRICSACGRLRDLEHFPKRKTIARLCHDCARV